MPMDGNSTLFRPIVPHQAVATLLLIENSRAMSYVWPDLRDLYLRTLVDTLEGANPAVPITILVLPSFPPDDQDLTPSVPRQYDGLHDGLQDFRFNYDSSNKLSVGKISSGIDFLASTKFQGQPAARHIIIVAASTPSEDTNGADLGPPEGRSPWRLLAQKLTQADIHCHMVLNPDENMTPLTTLFDETLHLQKNVEVQPWFPMTTERFLFRLSARPRHQLYSDAGIPPHTNSPLIRGSPLQRNYSFPPDTYTMNGADEMSEAAPPESQPDTSPSLVSQLQQVHGLTKKKVYGAKPTRQPFIREERVRDKYHRAPAPLMMPPSTSATSQVIQASNRSGRATSRSRADRVLRAGQGSPTDTHSRRQSGWPRRSSRLGSPESDVAGSVSTFSDISPTHPHYSPDMSPPISPTITIDDTYNIQPSIQSAGTIPSMSVNSGILAEPNWLQQQYRVTPPLSPPLSPQFPEFPSAPTMFPFFPANQLQGAVMDIETMNHDITRIQPPLYLDNTTLAPLTDGLNMNQSIQPKTTRSTNRADMIPQSSTLSRLSSPPQDESDKPFTFGKEYVAATAALFNQEVLPSYPNFPSVSPRSEPVRMNLRPEHPPIHGTIHFPPAQQILLPPPSTPTFGAEQSYGSSTSYSRPQEFLQQSVSRESTATLSSSPSSPPGSSSSLTGWAG